MLPIYHADHLVGRIDKDGPGLSFTYSATWREAEEAFAISTTMPIREERYAPEVATPWFANLLPEDRQLERISRLLGRDQGDVYSILEEIGRDTAGALSIGQPEPSRQGRYQKLEPADLAAAIDRLPERPFLVGDAGVTMSLAGAQSKLTVAVFDDEIFLPLDGAASTHILKPASQRLFSTVENELLCMQLAAATGLQAAPVKAGLAAGRPYLLIERYDRSIGDGRLVKRGHQEDFCQALLRYPTEKYESGGGPGLVDLFQSIDRVSRQPARDRLALLDLTIFACCIGDTDRHAKNFSLMLTDGGPRLAKGYDFMSALLYDGITANLAMRIADKSRADHLERRHWERFATQVGLGPVATVRRTAEFAARVAKTAPVVGAQLAETAGVVPDALKLFADAIAKRATSVAANCLRGPSTRRNGARSPAADTDSDPPG